MCTKIEGLNGGLKPNPLKFEHCNLGEICVINTR